MSLGSINNVDALVEHSKVYLEKLGLNIKRREDNLKQLKSEIDKIDETILEVQGELGRYYTPNVTPNGSKILTQTQIEEKTNEQIQRQEKSAAAILSRLNTLYEIEASNLQITQDIVGVVATLGQVPDDNLSRLFSEFLGLENMLAIVCKTYRGAKSLELYDMENRIDKSAGLHGLARSIGKSVDGRFQVICLESLRPYIGENVSEDPQKKLALLKPRLPNGECPRGFLGFAVNMIILDSKQLTYITSRGHGLRETLFYYLFSRLQVYETRADMQQAIPCISEGALSLDGGMMRSAGIFSLGNREDVAVRFSSSLYVFNPPTEILELEEKKKVLEWEKQIVYGDMQREEALLHHAKSIFDVKKKEMGSS